MSFSDFWLFLQQGFWSGLVTGSVYALLALETESGVYTDLSEGIFPMFGAPNVIVWGLPPE